MAGHADSAEQIDEHDAAENAEASQRNLSSGTRSAITVLLVVAAAVIAASTGPLPSG